MVETGQEIRSESPADLAGLKGTRRKLIAPPGA